jgi:hypothetical protein
MEFEEKEDTSEQKEFVKKMKTQALSAQLTCTRDENNFFESVYLGYRLA